LFYFVFNIYQKLRPKDFFAPGEKGKLSFEFDSSHFSGSVLRTLTVDTNQVRNSTVTLTFSAQVREEIRSTPSLLGVGEVLPEYNKSWLINLPTALRALSVLEELGIVKEVTGKERYKVFSYQAYLNILSAGTEPLKRL
jgi:hypothetical protein